LSLSLIRRDVEQKTMPAQLERHLINNFKAQPRDAKRRHRSEELNLRRQRIRNHLIADEDFASCSAQMIDSGHRQSPEENTMTKLDLRTLRTVSGGHGCGNYAPAPCKPLLSVKASVSVS
jgi:hypothetical protein